MFHALRRTAATVLAALLLPVTAHTAAAAPASVRAPGETVTLPVRDALDQLPVRVEDRTGYERSKFKHWVDADKDGCNGPGGAARIRFASLTITHFLSARPAIRCANPRGHAIWSRPAVGAPAGGEAWAVPRRQPGGGAPRTSRRTAIHRGASGGGDSAGFSYAGTTTTDAATSASDFVDVQ